MVILAIHRVLLQVMQGVVHPSHVPFQVEAETVNFRRSGHPGPGRGLFRHHQYTGKPALAYPVQILEETDRLQILMAAMFVRQPFTLIAGVVQVQHGGDGIHP